MNRLFVAYKPMFISSNTFLHRLKKRYKVKKAGFSGTLDPFACGTLIIAFGAYTKLFRFLQKTPKVYRATIWLGAKSKSLDLENILSITTPPKHSKEKIASILHSLQGEFTYTPPLFSAKKVNGKRAYQLATKNQNISLPPVTSYIHNIKLLAYNHPFITFEAIVSEGTYIRSIAEYVGKKLHIDAALSYLERAKEGKFIYENEKALNPLDYLTTKANFTTLSKEEIWQGKPISIDTLAIKKDGEYHLVFDTFFAIIAVKNQKVSYLLNQIPRAS